MSATTLGAVALRQPCRFQDPPNGRAAHAMANVAERAQDPCVAPRRVLFRHPDHQATDLSQDLTRLTEVRPYVHFRAMSCRCHRSNVSGVAIVAMSRRARWPTR